MYLSAREKEKYVIELHLKDNKIREIAKVRIVF